MGKRAFLVIFSLLIVLFLSTHVALAGQMSQTPSVAKQNNYISRAEIQSLFKKDKCNSSYSSLWKQKYLNKEIHWEGEIFSLSYDKRRKRTEVAVKILPETIMYDTLVYVPGDIRKDHFKDDAINFKGIITKGVDFLGVKEVQVSVRQNLQDNFGKFLFTNDDPLNLSFSK